MLVTGFALFLAVIGYFMVTSLAPRTTAAYEPSPIGGPAASIDSLVYDTVTIDAMHPTAWSFFAFDRGSVVRPPDTVGWDLAVRRFTVIAADAVADIGESSFDDVEEAPTSGYVETTFGRDTVNTAIDRWYRYSILSHILEPKGHVYVVRTRDGRFAKMEFLSYYCPGVVAGCLTFRYVYEPAGERRLVKQ